MSWWTSHGPKITNAATVAVVALSDPQLTSLVPPQYFPYVALTSMLLNAGLNIAHNVQHNAQTTPALPPPVPRS